MKKTYHSLWLRYQELSNENTRRLRVSKAPDRFDKAAEREQLLRRAFFADCRRYLIAGDIF